MKLKLLYMCLFLNAIAFSACELSRHRVKFYDSMKADFLNNDESFRRPDPLWRLAEELYKKNFEQGLEYAQAPRIPYIIHHIWLGSNLPKYAQEFRQSWIAKHNSWTFILWTDHPELVHGNIILHSFEELAAYLKNPKRERFIMMDMRSVRLTNQVAFDTRAKNYGEKSDVLRYEALHKIGGLYVDTDFECLRSFKDFNHCFDFYTGISHTREFVLYNGLIGAAPGMSILKEIIESLTDRPIQKDSLNYSGPYFFTDCFIRKLGTFEGRAVAFPVTFFYAWPPYERHISAKKAQRYLVKESYALHYWKVSWLQKSFVVMKNKLKMIGPKEAEKVF